MFCKSFSFAKLIQVELFYSCETSYSMITRQEKSILPTSYGDFHMIAYAEMSGEKMPHIVLVHKDHDVSKGPSVVRIHSECLTGDIFASKRCDCGEQLQESMSIINEHAGILIYLRQEGRGIGILNKMKAYNHQDEGLNTIEANITLGFGADERNYFDAIYILNDIGVNEIELITNNPLKLKAFDDSSIKVNKRIPIIIGANEVNKSYLQTKADQMGHILGKS